MTGHLFVVDLAKAVGRAFHELAHWATRRGMTVTYGRRRVRRYGSIGFRRASKPAMSAP